MRHLIVLLLLAGFASACSTGPPDEVAAEAEVDPFLSEEITVSGKVDEVFPGRAFTIDGNDVSFGDGESTLVLAPDASAVNVNGFVRARGAVSRLVLEDADAAFVSRYGEDLLRTFDGEYVVTASSVEAMKRPGREAAVLEKALDNPETEILETLTVTAVVQEVMAPQVFWVAGRGEDGVLVVSENRPEIDEGDVVEMTGTIRRFDPAVIQSEAGIILRSDVADQVRQRLAEDVVFVADYLTLANLNGE